MLANDANCFALAETLLGVGKDYPNADLVFGVINDPILLSYSKSSLKTKIE
jgi:hypothetical protein